jgi:hypothetical protein
MKNILFVLFVLVSFFSSFSVYAKDQYHWVNTFHSRGFWYTQAAYLKKGKGIPSADYTV